MNWRNLALLLLVISHASPLFAKDPACPKGILVEIKHKLKDGELGISQKIKVQIPSENREFEAVFLGRMVGQSGRIQGFAVYDTHTNEVHILPLEDLEIRSRSGRSVDPEDSTPLVLSKRQHGPDCAAYGLYNCVNQLRAMGRDGPAIGRLSEGKAAREKELKKLQKLVSKPKLGHKKQLRNTIAYLKENGIRFRRIRLKPNHDQEGFDDQAQGIHELEDHLRDGKPAILDYQTSAEDSLPVETRIVHGDAIKKTKKPFSISFPGFDGGGHRIVLMGLIDLPGGKKTILLDSNNKGFRLVDISAFKPPFGFMDILLIK